MSHVDARFRSRRFRDESEIGRITIFGAETPKNRWRPARDVIVMPSGNFPDGRFLSENRRRMLPSPGNFLWPTTKKLSHTSRRFRGVPESQNPGGSKSGNPGVPKSRNQGLSNPGGVPPLAIGDPKIRGGPNPEIRGSRNLGIGGCQIPGGYPPLAIGVPEIRNRGVQNLGFRDPEISGSGGQNLTVLGNPGIREFGVEISKFGGIKNLIVFLQNLRFFGFSNSRSQKT